MLRDLIDRWRQTIEQHRVNADVFWETGHREASDLWSLAADTLEGATDELQEHSQIYEVMFVRERFSLDWPPVIDRHAGERTFLLRADGTIESSTHDRGPVQHSTGHWIDQGPARERLQCLIEAGARYVVCFEYQGRESWVGRSRP